MREAIGGTWLFQIVIFFILLFTGYMCLTINQSKAFNVKNQIIETIQSYNGIDLNGGYNNRNQDAFTDIVNYIQENSFRTTGYIPDAEEINDQTYRYECFDRNGQNVGNNGDRAVFCITKIDVSEDASIPSDSANELPSLAYYRVVVFYRLDLPIFGSLFNFQITGDTRLLYGGVNS